METDIINNIISRLITNFDLNYMFSINALTYIIIRIWDDINKNKKVNTWQKRLVLVISIIVITIFYKKVGYDDNIVLINSAILAPICWSWLFKPIFSKLGIGYKQIDKILK